MVVGAAHDLVPQLARRAQAVDPQAVVALVRAVRLLRLARLGAVHQFDLAALLHRAHEGVGHAHRDVEVLQVAGVLGVDEEFDVGVVAAQHAHLRATPAAGRFDGLAAAVEDTHVAQRPRRAAARAADPRALGPDAREVVTHAAAAAHRLGGLGQRGVDAGVAVVDRGDRIAHRLHEAVDQRGRQVGAGGGVDAPGRHEAAPLRIDEARFPAGALGWRLHRGQGAGHAQSHGFDGVFFAFGVLFDQHLAADRLLGQGSAARCGGVGWRSLCERHGRIRFRGARVAPVGQWGAGRRARTQPGADTPVNGRTVPGIQRGRSRRR